MLGVRTSACLATIAGHNTTQSIYHPLSRKQRNERNMRDAGMFLLHIVTAAQQTLVLWWWHVLLSPFMFMWPHDASTGADIQLRSPSVVYLVSPKNTDFWLITAHNRSVVTNTGLWIVTLKCVSLASCWWLVAGGLTAKWQNYSQLFINCPFLSEASICNYTLDWQTNSGTSM